MFYSNFIRRNHPVEWDDVAEIRDNIRTYMLSGLVPDETIEPNMVSEQNFQCAYTEIDIEENANSSHIDHFHKQSIFPALRFEWSNLFTSTNNTYYGAKHKDNTYRLQQEDFQYLINPSIENPNDYFKYSFTGEILIKVNDENSSEYKKAKLTKDAFNLNERSLVEQRQTVAKIVKIYFEQQFAIDEIKMHIGKFDSLVDDIYKNLTDLYS
jgi:uncharacterized protein (TIGR02646 family)